MIEKAIRKSNKVTFGGIVAAISIIFMLLAGLIYGTDFVFPLFAGLLLIPVYKLMGKGWAVLVYVTVSVLSFLLIIRPEPPIVYLSFLGYYPIIKESLEKIKIRWIGYTIKYLIFNIAVLFILWATPIVAKIFGLPTDNLSFIERLPVVAVVIIVAVSANFFFYVYDMCINRVTAIYMNRLHGIFSKIIKR